MSYSINKKDVEVISLLVANLKKYTKSNLISVDEVFESISRDKRKKMYKVLNCLFENPELYKFDFFILKDSSDKFYLVV